MRADAAWAAGQSRSEPPLTEPAASLLTAHITADSEEMGLAIVTNGLSLCKIHHAA